MAGLTPLDRFPGEDVRIRRALGRLGVQLRAPSGLTLGFDGIAVAPVAPINVTTSGVGLNIGVGLTILASNLIVELAATNPGLQFISNGLAVLPTPGGNIVVGTTGVDLASDTTIVGTSAAAYFETTTVPTVNLTGTVTIIAKDANLLTANEGWLPFKRSDGTIVYTPYWL